MGSVPVSLAGVRYSSRYIGSMVGDVHRSGPNSILLLTFLSALTHRKSVRIQSLTAPPPKM
jgi:hypothetical protein